MACGGVAPCLQSSNTHLVAISTLRPISKHAQPFESWSIRNVSPKENLVWCSRRGNSSTGVIRSSVAEFPAGPSSVSSKEEAIRKADAYFATDSRPIVLFDGKEDLLPFSLCCCFLPQTSKFICHHNIDFTLHYPITSNHNTGLTPA